MDLDKIQRKNWLVELRKEEKKLSKKEKLVRDILSWLAWGNESKSSKVL